MNKDLIPVRSKELAAEALKFCESIQEITIGNDDEYQQAGEFTKRIIDYSRRVETERKKIIGPFEETIEPLKNKISEINGYFKETSDPLNNIEKRLRYSMSSYQKYLEDKRIEDQRRLNEAAEKERLRLAEESRKAAQKSQKAAEKGDLKEAARYHVVALNKQQIAESIDAVPVQTEAPKVEGISYRDKWSAKVQDQKAFIKHCLETDNLQFIEINIAMLHALAQSTKGQMKLPGIEFVCGKILIRTR